MEQYRVEVYNINTFETIENLIVEFSRINELKEFMTKQIHNYKEPYYNISYIVTNPNVKELNKWTNVNVKK